MDRKVIYNGRVSKLPMPKGTRPSDRENNCPSSTLRKDEPNTVIQACVEAAPAREENNKSFNK